MAQNPDRLQGGYADTLQVGERCYTYFPVARIAGADKLPYSLTVLLENVLRNAASDEEATKLAECIVEAGCSGTVGSEVEFSPARVLFQDFTGVPVFVDFAVMREACAQLGGDPKKINPQVPCDEASSDVITTCANFSMFSWWQMPDPGGTMRTFSKESCAQRRNS